MAQNHVVAFGEVLWDELPTGRVPGGAPANFAYHVQRLGNPVTLISAVGRDASGKELLAVLESKGISVEHVGRNDLPTGHVSVSLQNGIPSYTIHEPVAWDAIGLPQNLQTLLEDAGAVYYGTLALRRRASQVALEELLRQAGGVSWKICDINLRQNFFSAEILDFCLKNANVLKLNDEELPVVARELQIQEENTQKSLAVLMARYQLKYIILTLGAKGSAIFDGGSLAFYPCAPCTVRDTVGCGDSFIAAWCASILQGESVEMAMEKATRRAALVASLPGGMPELQ